KSTLRVRKGPKIYGPYTREQVAILLAQGRIADTDLVSENDGPWVALANLAAEPSLTPSPIPVNVVPARPGPPPLPPPAVALLVPGARVAGAAPPVAEVDVTLIPIDAVGRRTSSWKNRLPLMAAAAVLLLAALGGGGWYLWGRLAARVANDLKFLPDHSDLVVSVNLASLLDSKFYQEIKAEMSGMDEKAELEFQKLSGLTWADISRVTAGVSFEDTEGAVLVIRTKRAVTANDILAKKRGGDYKEVKAGKYIIHEMEGKESF